MKTAWRRLEDLGYDKCIWEDADKNTWSLLCAPYNYDTKHWTVRTQKDKWCNLKENGKFRNRSQNIIAYIILDHYFENNSLDK